MSSLKANLFKYIVLELKTFFLSSTNCLNSFTNIYRKMKQLFNIFKSALSLPLFCIIIFSMQGHIAFAGTDYRWLDGSAGESLAKRIELPEGFQRIPVSDKSFAAWLRGLPVQPGRPHVYLYNGSKKTNQLAHHCVLKVDVGKRDLQQCADAVIRLRAEYLYAAGCEDAIAFKFTSGDIAPWNEWSNGIRPRVRGNKVSWHKVKAPDESYKNFRRYLDTVFTYAGSASLSKELEKVPDPSKVEVGDVFIQGGFPGHAVLVVDVAINNCQERYFLLAQSYMPAQEIHVLRNLKIWRNPWYKAKSEGILLTPEWKFRYEDLRRFPRNPLCPNK